MLCEEEAHGRVAAQRPIELRRIYVMPEWHGAGVADGLILRAISEATSGGHDLLWLGVSGSNIRASSFYAKHGFKVSGAYEFPLAGVIYEGFLMSREINHADAFWKISTRRCD